MKKNILLWTIATLICALSCNVLEENQFSSRIVSFTAVQCDSPSSRSVLQSDGAVYWSPGDAINLFYGVSESAKFTSDNTEPVAQANFNGSLEGFIPNGSDDFWAVYPYAAENAFDGSAISLTLPDVQTGKAGTFDNNLLVSLARSKDYTLQFYNLCGGVKFSVANEGIKYVTFRGNANEALAGQVKVAFDSNGKPQVQEVLDGETEIRLNAPNNGTFEVGKWYYLAALPATLSAGYTMSFYKDELFAERVTDTPILIKRSINGKLANADEADAPVAVGKYLTFTSEGVTTLSLSNYGGNAPVLFYSTDTINWSQWDYSGLTITKETPLYLYGDNSEGFSFSLFPESRRYSKFTATGNKFGVSGNLMSLLDKDQNILSIPTVFCFAYLFNGCTNLTSAPDLPATTLTDYCYAGMFKDCKNLISAPSLPATVLSNYGYYYMFDHCEELAIAPDLPATTLADYCYQSMFDTCRNLKCAPDLPAAVLAEGCYYSMFSNCNCLTDAPELPATKMVDYCYYNMFSYCSSLTKAPELPATKLAKNCYSCMFCCTGLSSAPALPATTLAEYCYDNMFSGCTSLTDAPDLPASYLADYCYWGMFSSCYSLTSAPDLSATELAKGCYGSMFNGCTSLTKAPELPATSLKNECYWRMFMDCESLSVAPGLPATILADHCYEDMFYHCIKLTEAPNLPATTLADYCYYGMFGLCSNLEDAPLLPATIMAESCYRRMFFVCEKLTKAPVLLATALVDHCYEEMFCDCSRLNYIKCLATDISAQDCIREWLSGVSTTGTFVQAPDMTDWPSGKSGIPIGWSIQDAI